MSALIAPFTFVFGIILTGGSLLWALVSTVAWIFGDELNLKAVAALVVFGGITLVSWIIVRKEMEDELKENNEIYKRNINNSNRVPADGAELGV